MKLSFLHHSKFQLSFPGRSLAAACVLATLLAGPVFGGSQQVGGAALPIQTLPARAGVFSGLRAEETANRLLVTGGVKKNRGLDLPSSAHVDVKLLAADGTLIAEARDDINPSHPRLSRARRGRIPFVVSFPLAKADAAARIVVRYHPTFHSAGGSCPS